MPIDPNKMSGVSRLQRNKKSAMAPSSPAFCSGARRSTQSSSISRTDKGFGGGGGSVKSLSGPKPGKKSK